MTHTTRKLCVLASLVLLTNQQAAAEGSSCAKAAADWKAATAVVMQYKQAADDCLAAYNTIERPSDVARQERVRAEASKAFAVVEAGYGARDEFVPRWVRTRHEPYYYGCRETVPDTYLQALILRGAIQHALMQTECPYPWQESRR